MRAMTIAVPNEPYGYRGRSARRWVTRALMLGGLIAFVLKYGVGAVVGTLIAVVIAVVALVAGAVAAVQRLRVRSSPHWREAEALRLALDGQAWRGDRAGALASLAALRDLARQHPDELAVTAELTRAGAEVAQRFGPSLEAAQLDALLDDVDRVLERPAAARRIAPALAHLLATVGDVLDHARRARAERAWQRLIACAPRAAAGGAPRWLGPQEPV